MIENSDILLLKNLTLLYVEDNKRVLNEVESIFSNIFKKIYIAENGSKALDEIENNHIDIIISDISMPVMDGITMAEEIRKFNKKVSIIFLTAYADKDLLLRASNLQIDGYLTKPINFNKIFNTISNALTRYDVQTKFVLADNVEYLLHSKKLVKDSIEIPLGNKEHLLLNYLIVNSHKLVTKEEIAGNVWIYEDMSDSALKNVIYHLRKKIGKECIENITGQGYRLNVM